MEAYKRQAAIKRILIYRVTTLDKVKCVGYNNHRKQIIAHEKLYIFALIAQLDRASGYGPEGWE
ncbi:MAG: hypothetical protein J1F71_06375, partial [Clostridiales bacterium]|nr:hypothetical protein [Clostridiales bacterium]